MNKKYSNKFFNAKIEVVDEKSIALIFPKDLILGDAKTLFFTVTGDVVQMSVDRPSCALPFLMTKDAFVPQSK